MLRPGRTPGRKAELPPPVPAQAMENSGTFAHGHNGDARADNYRRRLPLFILQRVFMAAGSCLRLISRRDAGAAGSSDGGILPLLTRQGGQSNQTTEVAFLERRRICIANKI